MKKIFKDCIAYLNSIPNRTGSMQRRKAIGVAICFLSLMSASQLVSAYPCTEPGASNTVVCEGVDQTTTKPTPYKREKTCCYQEFYTLSNYWSNYGGCPDTDGPGNMTLCGSPTADQYEGCKDDSDWKCSK